MKKEVLALEYDYYKSISIALLALNFVIAFGIINSFPYLVENNQKTLALLLLIGFLFIGALAYYFIQFKIRYFDLLDLIKKAKD